MKYIWTKYNLMDQIDLLERLKKGKSNQERAEINRNIRSIEDFIQELEVLGEFASTKECLEISSLYLRTHPFLVDDIKNARYNETFLFPFELKENKEKFSKDAILSMTHDFYKSFDKEFFKIFMGIFKERYSNVVFQEQIDANYEACTFGIPYLSKLYLSICHSDGLVPIFSSVHEYGHGIAFMMNHQNLASNPKEFLEEVFSLFFEQVLVDFLAKKKKLNHVYDFAYDTFRDNVEMAYDANEIINLTSLYGEIGCEKNKTFKKEALKRFNYDSEYIDSINSSNLEIITPYLFGYLVAIELYELYKFDHEKAIYVLKKLMMLNNLTELEYYKEMKKLGIHPNSHVSDYVSDLQDKLERK